MTTHHQMPPARRRPIAGMPSNPPPATPPADTLAAAPTLPSPRSQHEDGGEQERSSNAENSDPVTVARRPAADYGATRLVNFRLPIDLHDCYKQLVHEIEQRHPRLRHPSLTELVIALFEEGPVDADQAAELIRRKRAAEHGVRP